VDFKQIEILALAILSGDKQLTHDILAGVDIHEATGSKVYGHKMSKEERRVVKTINFGLIYGGGVFTLAKQAKVPVLIAKKATDAFYGRYPGVREYFDSVKGNIQRMLDVSGLTTGVILPSGFYQKIVSYKSSTGRRYSFKDYYSEKTKAVEVSHTETRNYPIQGFATGDLVLCALGEVWRKVLTKYKDDVKLVGLVHDSLRFDLKLDRLDEFVGELKYRLESSGEALNRACKKNVWTLPIKVTFSKGTDFFNMEEFEVR
jgi:DNA polymerase-1